MPPFILHMATVIPTLGADLFLTQANVQLTYLLRTFSIFPDNTMPFLTKQMPSLGALAAAYGSDANTLVGRVKDAVATLVKNTFPDGNTVVSCDTATSDGVLTLTITVSLTIDGNTTSQTAIATIKNGNVTIPNDTVPY